MKISGASCLVLGVCVAIAMVAGCSGSPNVTPMQSGSVWLKIPIRFTARSILGSSTYGTLKEKL